MGPWKFFIFAALLLVGCGLPVVGGRFAGVPNIFMLGLCAATLGSAAYCLKTRMSMGDQMGVALVDIPTEATPTDPGYLWAGTIHSFFDACKHFITVGSTGSGKSVTIKLLMQSVFCKWGDGKTKRRTVIYDCKADLVDEVASYLPKGVPIYVLNPLDARFSPWDIGTDIVTETDALEFAAALIPKAEHESSPYFTNAGQALVAGVMQRLMVDGSKWSLRDVINAFHDKPTLEAVLTHPATSYLLDHFSEANEKNFAGVKSTVDTAISLYRPIAAVYDAAVTTPRNFKAGTLGPIDPTPFSLRRWIKDGGVLILGNHENARQATDTLNRLVFHQMSKLLMARDPQPNEETWVFLDEAREAGALPGLRQLLLRGRSKRVAVVLGFQDVEGMYAAYGQHEGAEIVGAPQNVSILHINSTATETAKWASDVFGSPLKQQASITDGNFDDQKRTRSLGFMPNVPAIVFTQLPLPSESNGMHYFAYTEKTGHGKGHYEPSYLKSDGPWQERIASIPNFMEETEASRFRLQPWSTEEAERFPQKKPAESPKAKPANERAKAQDNMAALESWGHPYKGKQSKKDGESRHVT